MTVFTYSQARQNFSSLLDIARREGNVQIKRRDGTLYSISPVKRSKRSPFSVRGVKTRATTRDILLNFRMHWACIKDRANITGSIRAMISNVFTFDRS